MAACSDNNQEESGDNASHKEDYPEEVEDPSAPLKATPNMRKELPRLHGATLMILEGLTQITKNLVGEVKKISQNIPGISRRCNNKNTVPAIGDSATVKPYAPAFEVDPIETQCIKIHPSGSVVRFKLVPHKQGLFEVGADVIRYDSSDCSGDPTPQTAATLQVLVKVDRKEFFLDRAIELWNILWEKFVEFWAALVTIFFGAILFLIRKKLKKLIGYGDNLNYQISQECNFRLLPGKRD